MGRGGVRRVCARNKVGLLAWVYACTHQVKAAARGSGGRTGGKDLKFR